MQLTKKDFIQKLYKIQDETNLDLTEQIQEVVSSDIIPIEIIKLINKYDKQYLNVYDTFNAIYLARNKNPLYRNLKKEVLPIEEKSIALSSFVTKVLISCKKIEDINERKEFASLMGVEEINNALTDYILQNNEEGIKVRIKEIRDLLKILYKE